MARNGSKISQDGARIDPGAQRNQESSRDVLVPGAFKDRVGYSTDPRILVF